MARCEHRLQANAPGPFFVDASCIDCGSCWPFDPLHVAPTGTSAHVQRQPQGADELQQTPRDGYPALVHRHAFAAGVWRPALQQTLAFNRRSPGC
ncbi:MAG: hypothetical protein ACKO5M_04765 [Vulcanococcus sp.]